MKRTPLKIRLRPDVKKAAEDYCRDVENRSLSNWIEKLMISELRRRGVEVSKDTSNG